MKSASVIACALGIAACAATHSSIDGPEAASARAKFETLKSLAGTWKSEPRAGARAVELRYRVTAGQSVVEETLFPGTEDEMVSMYHLDGGRLVMTHYCTAGNQPRMQVGATGDARTLEFDFLDATNLRSLSEMHMHSARIVVKDADHIEEWWQGWAGGKPDPSHLAHFVVARQQ